MENLELVSRSQLLLQYLMAVEIIDGQGGIEHSFAAPEVGGAAGDSECFA